jgi:hypothetical protein
MSNSAQESTGKETGKKPEKSDGLVHRQLQQQPIRPYAEVARLQQQEQRTCQ